MSATTITSPVTEEDEDSFTTAHCQVLSQELGRLTGWPQVVVSDGPHGKVGWVHAGVLTPDEKILDISGVHEQDEWVDRYFEIALAYGEDHDDWDPDDVAVFPATDHGWTPESGWPVFPALAAVDPQVVSRAAELAPLLLERYFDHG